MTTTERPDTLRRILDHSSRADPYPLYAELRRTPVALQEDGSYVISTYRELTGILHDPRLSSDVRNLARPMAAVEGRATPSFINLDPPEHDRLRRLAMRHFGPPHTPGLVSGMEPGLTATVSGLIDGFADEQRIDIVDEFAYPFPVTVICRLLGVPREDEPRFHVWVNAIIESIDYDPRTDPQEKLDNGVQATKDLREYLGGLLEVRHGHPGDDLLTRLANDDGPDGRMTDEEIISTANLLLIAGHETTVKPHRQRHADAAAPPRGAAPAARRTRPRRTAGGGTAALRAPGADHSLAGGVQRHHGRRHRHPQGLADHAHARLGQS